MVWYKIRAKLTWQTSAATWMDLETVTPREGEISDDIPYMWNLKRNDTNELIYKTETDS